MLITTIAENQYVLIDGQKRTFVSYETTIAVVDGDSITVVDGDSINGNWRKQGKPPLNYSSTTSKHLCRFLGMDKPSVYQAIKDGRISVVKEL